MGNSLSKLQTSEGLERCVRRPSFDMSLSADDRRRLLIHNAFSNLVREDKLLAEACYNLNSKKSRNKKLEIRHGLTAALEKFAVAVHIRQEDARIVLLENEWMELISSLSYIQPLRWDVSSSAHNYRISSCNLDIKMDPLGNVLLEQTQPDDNIVFITINSDIIPSIESINSFLLSHKSCFLDTTNFGIYYENVLFLTSKMRDVCNFDVDADLKRNIRSICEMIGDDYKMCLMEECLYFAIDRIKDDLNPEKSLILQYNFL